MASIPKLLRDITPITHLTGCNNYSWLHYRDGQKGLITKSLSLCEKWLPGFIRVHKTALVNPTFVKQIEVPAIKKQSGSIVLNESLVVPYSRRRKATLATIFGLELDKPGIYIVP